MTRQEPLGASELTEQAIEELETRGWCQGRLENETGEVCYLGAYEFAMAQLGVSSWQLYREAWQASHKEFAELGGKGTGYDIPAWNDAPGRTKEEVLERMTLVAKRLRDKGL